MCYKYVFFVVFETAFDHGQKSRRSEKEEGKLFFSRRLSLLLDAATEWLEIQISAHGPTPVKLRSRAGGKRRRRRRRRLFFGAPRSKTFRSSYPWQIALNFFLLKLDFSSSLFAMNTENVFPLFSHTRCSRLYNTIFKDFVQEPFFPPLLASFSFL